MKKLMMTTVAALGFAVCAQAADGGVLNSTGFEDYEGKDFKVNATDTGATEGHQYWTGDGEADFTQTVLKTYEDAGIEAPTNVPDAFANAASNATFLSVDTGSAVMYRRAANDPMQTLNLSVGNPVFFDADVKFTASESAVEASTGDKLLVWLKGDDTTTNLIVTAGILDDRGVVTNTATFVTDAEVEADTWYRLTVKAGVDEKNCTYFNVYIDGNLVSSDETTTFYSLVQSGSARYTIAEAGFQGTGALDNVVWTTTDPFPAVEPTTVALAVNVTGEYSSLVYIVGESTTTNEVDGTAASIEAAVDDVVTFVLTVANGYTPAVTGYELQKGEEQVDEFSDVYYPYTFTATVTQAMIEDGLTLTINVTKDGGEEPVVPETGTAPAGGSATVKAADAAAAEAAVTVQVDDAVAAVLTAEQKATFADTFFTKTVVDNQDGTYTVSVAVKEGAVEAKLDEVVAEALETAADGKITTIPAGLCYKIESGSTVGLGTEAKGVSTGATIEVKGLTPEAGFYKVSLDVAPIK